MRVIAYDILADYADEYLDTTIKSVRRITKLIIRMFGDVYLRSPNEEDTIRLMAINEKRG